MPNVCRKTRTALIYPDKGRFLNNINAVGKTDLLISVVCVMCGLTLLQVQHLENITLLLLCVLLAE
ncbi:hypothetical protein ACLK1S_08510 [Escherichia coli]